MLKIRLIAIAGSGALHALFVMVLLMQPVPTLERVGQGSDVSSMEVFIVQTQERGGVHADQASPVKRPAPAHERAEARNALPEGGGAGSSAALAAVAVSVSSSADALAPVPGAAASGGAQAIDSALDEAASAAYSEYQRILLEHIRAYQFYPDNALHLSGRSQVGFVIERNGAVLQIWIESSSGSAILDRAAMETLRRAQPLPMIPASLPDTMSILLPVDFSGPQMLGADGTDR